MDGNYLKAKSEKKKKKIRSAFMPRLPSKLIGDLQPGYFLLRSIQGIMWVLAGLIPFMADDIRYDSALV